MTEVIKIIEYTKQHMGNNDRAKAVQKRWNGYTFNTTQGIKGILCGVNLAHDYWIYWIEGRSLAHHTTAISTIPNATLRGNKTGDINYYDIPEELHAEFMEIAAQYEAMQQEPEKAVFTPAIVAPVDYSVLEHNQLPGFIHCVELDYGYAPKKERYINLNSIIALEPCGYKEGVYSITTKADLFWAYIPDHQFQN